MVSRQWHRLMAVACLVLLATVTHQLSWAQSRHTQGAATPGEGGENWLPANTLTLRAALDLALANHPDLRVAGAALAAARSDSMFAGIPVFNPQLELRTSRGGESLASGAEGTLEVELNQELELWGKRGARRHTAAARSQTAASERDAIAQEIESDVRARFEQALFLQDRLALAEQLAELDRRVVLATQSRVRDGSLTPVTGRLTELDWLRLEAHGLRARSDLRQALVALGIAVGRALPDSTRLAGEAETDSLVAPEDSVVAIALRIRGRGEVLRRRIDERKAELKLAEREARPNFTLGLGLTRDRQVFSRDEFAGDPSIVQGIAGATSTDNLWTARLSAPLPVWQTNQAGRARAAAEIGRSQAEYERYRLRTQSEVLGAVRRFEDAAGLYRLYLERSTGVRQDLVLIRDAYSDGRISLDSYLTQKGRLVDTLLGQLEAGDSYWDARGQLEAAVGLDLARINAGGVR